MTKIHPLLALATTAVLASLPTKARADQFDFNYSGNGVEASGVLTTGAYSDNIGGLGLEGWQITEISGQRNGVAIDGLWNDSNFPGPAIIGDVEFDNVLLASPLGFDYYGLAYTTVAGQEFNVYSQDFPTGGGYYDWQDGTGNFIPVTLDPSPVPDRANTAVLVLLVVGLYALGILRQRRQSLAAHRP
jgi:hypothetical protein